MSEIKELFCKGDVPDSKDILAGQAYRIVYQARGDRGIGKIWIDVMIGEECDSFDEEGQDEGVQTALTGGGQLSLAEDACERERYFKIIFNRRESERGTIIIRWSQSVSEIRALLLDHVEGKADWNLLLHRGGG